MTTTATRHAVATAQIETDAEMLVRCQHPALIRVGPRTEWCERCGCIKTWTKAKGGHSIRPHLHEDLRDALGALHRRGP